MKVTCVGDLIDICLAILDMLKVAYGDRGLKVKFSPVPDN